MKTTHRLLASSRASAAAPGGSAASCGLRAFRAGRMDGRDGVEWSHGRGVTQWHLRMHACLVTRRVAHSPSEGLVNQEQLVVGPSRLELSNHTGPDVAGESARDDHSALPKGLAAQQVLNASGAVVEEALLQG